MTDSSIIQQARDTLAKWRQLAYDTAWEVDTNRPFSTELVGLFVEADSEYAVKFDPDELPHISTARLIVGTAGNPALWEALDGLLACGAEWDEYEPDHVMASQARHIAAAIIAAAERMTS